jgi:hypothetical protein
MSRCRISTAWKSAAGREVGSRDAVHAGRAGDGPQRSAGSHQGHRGGGGRVPVQAGAPAGAARARRVADAHEAPLTRSIRAERRS